MRARGNLSEAKHEHESDEGASVTTRKLMRVIARWSVE